MVDEITTVVPDFCNEEDTLRHYGVKDMRWGVRRYQNPDGSRTALGKKHEQELYGVGEEKTKAEKKYDKAKWKQIDSELEAAKAQKKAFKATHEKGENKATLKSINRNIKKLKTAKKLHEANMEGNEAEADKLTKKYIKANLKAAKAEKKAYEKDSEYDSDNKAFDKAKKKSLNADVKMAKAVSEIYKTNPTAVKEMLKSTGITQKTVNQLQKQERKRAEETNREIERMNVRSQKAAKQDFDDDMRRKAEADFDGDWVDDEKRR